VEINFKKLTDLTNPARLRGFLFWTILIDVLIMKGPRLERPEVKPLKHALVDDRIGIPKKPSCFQAGSSTFYKVE
jgi:hypothetical protein